MPEINVKSWKNKTLRKLPLAEEVFDYPLKSHLIYEAVCAYRAAGRAGTHKAKNRTEVSGGTRKVWRQKGTGRARVGDNRSPLWRHGGTVHGPKPRDYSWSLPKKMRRNALRSVISDKIREGKLVCVDKFKFDTPKTKTLEQALREDLGIGDKALLVPLETHENLSLASRNNPRVNTVRALAVSVVDLLDHDTVVISEEALQRLGEVLGR